MTLFRNSTNDYLTKTLEECCVSLLEENPLMLESNMKKDDGLFYIIYTSNLLLETINSLKPNQVSAFGYILEQDQLLKIKKNIKPLSPNKFEIGQKLLGKRAKYGGTLYSTSFAKKTNDFVEMFSDSEAVFYNYDKDNNTNCLAEIRFIFTPNEACNTKNIAAAGATVAAFAATLLAAISEVFNNPILNKLLNSNLPSLDFSSQNSAIASSIISLFGYGYNRYAARKKNQTIITAICNLMTKENTENLVFEPLYYPFIETNTKRMINNFSPVSKEFIVRIIAYEKE